MATVYGSVANSSWRAQLDYTTSSSNTSYSIATTGKINLTNADEIATGDGIAGLGSIKVENSATGQTTATKTWSGPSNSDVTAVLSKTFTITRTHSSQSITVASKVTVTTCQKWSGASHTSISGNSTASVSITVPAKPSYTVKYNANGGSGAPSNQTKWYGESLTLSSTTPTRSGYTFAGWNTSSAGTGTNYASGGSYTGNAALTLYAKWTLDYKPPTLKVTGAYRADSSGNASDDGAYAVVNATFSCFGSYHPSAWNCTVNGISSTSPTYTSGSASSTSGAVSFLVNAQMDSNLQYTASVTLTDNSGNSGASSTATRTIQTAYFPIDVTPGGHGIGIGRAAPESGLGVGLPATFDNNATTHGYARTLSEDIDRDGSNPSATTWSKSFQCLDKDGELIAAFGSSRETDGRERAYMFAYNEDSSGNAVSNALNLFVAKDGTATYTMTSPSAFCAALHVGDRVTNDQSSAVSMTNSAWVNSICTVSLAAGTWVIAATLQISSNATGRRIAVLSTSSGNPSDADRRQNSAECMAVNGDATYLNVSTTMVLSATTTVYLKGWQNSGSALSAYGYISAVRVK